MKIIRANDYADMSRKAANILSAQIILKPDCVLGLATGGTPVGAYQQLVEWYNKGDLDFSGVTTVNLDEYRGLPKDHPESYWSFMHRNLFDHVNIDPAHIHLQLLGLGPNGHIGFNEPGKAFELETHCVDLTEATIEANKRFFDGNEDLVPRQAYTMGIKTIMQARKVLVVANGLAKAKAVKAVVSGPVTPECPGSILQLHPDCTLVADEEALSLL